MKPWQKLILKIFLKNGEMQKKSVVEKSVRIVVSSL